MAEEITANELEARALLESRGFKKFSFSYRPEAMLGLRWTCLILDVFAPVLHGKADGSGFTPMDAARKALACRPVLLSPNEAEEDEDE